MDIIFDCETYPNCFLLCAKEVESGVVRAFEISEWKNDTSHLIDWMNRLKAIDATMVGFNNIGFDYPVLHFIYRRGDATPHQIYDRAKEIIDSESKFEHVIYPSDRVVRQIDLFKIHHFDNKARSTSLKALEFNMRMDKIRNLPFAPGTVLDIYQIITLKEYCWDDVNATQLFMEQSKEQIEFRKSLIPKYPNQDVLNYADVKLGKMIFQSHLEANGVECYEYGPRGRQPKQTPRPLMHLKECIPDCVRGQFVSPEFIGILNFFNDAVITETKGAFKDLKATVGGLDFMFGTGGIHASVENERFDANEEMMILDIDVTGMYPAISMEHNLYPEHLGPKFVEVYKMLRAQRAQFKKGTVENGALKLAMNGVYGASGDKFSIFYDPLFTMKITVGGQLMMAMLAERLLQVEELHIIQANTDGITMFIPRRTKLLVDLICWRWEQDTKLQLEQVEYQTMCVADVNSYIAKTVDGKVKRKGRYEYDVEWHQDASSLVVPKVAEKVLLEGAKMVPTLRQWANKMDFMIRVKVPRSSALVWELQPGNEARLDNMQRFYASTEGGYLWKYMPPLARKPDEWRRIAVLSGQKVCPCNDMGNATEPIDYHWYEHEIEKLTLGVL